MSRRGLRPRAQLAARLMRLLDWRASVPSRAFCATLACMLGADARGMPAACNCRSTGRRPILALRSRSKIPGHPRGRCPRRHPIPGIYELTRGADIAYVTADGKYAISGDLLDLANNDNLTEAHRRDAARRS